MVLVQNLIKRDDKRLVFKSHAYHALMPISDDSFYQAIDGKSLGKSELECRCKLKDLNSEENVSFHERSDATLGEIAADLTYFKMLKRVAAGDEPVLILLDDQRLTISWPDLQRYTLQTLSDDSKKILPDDWKSTLPNDWKIFQLYYFTENENEIVEVKPIAPYKQISFGLLGKGIDACYYTAEGASWAIEASKLYSHRYRLEQCLREHQNNSKQSQGLYTSLIPLAEDIGGKDFWVSDQTKAN